MNWYYMAKGAASDERKGPVPHPQFIAMVQEGKVVPTTLACSPELTGGQWLMVKDIPILRKAVEDSAAEKRQARREQRIEQQPPVVGVAAPKVVTPPVPPPDPYASSVPQQPFVQPRMLPSLHVRPVFQHYWMPDYLQAIWYLTLAFCALWFLFVLTAAIGAASYAEKLDSALISMIIPTMFSVVGILVVVLAVRFVLELYAIFFDIRSFMKRQTDLLEQKAAKDGVL